MTMKKKFLFPATVFVLFMVGCMGNDSKVDTEKHTGAEVPHLESEGHRAGLIPLSDEVKLDNGEKWVANIETNEGIHNMLTMVENEESKETRDYVGLKENLDEEFNVVLEKCTMIGESHDQLHNYLLPLKARIDNLDPNSKKEAIEDIRKYLLTYHSYFK